MDGFRKIRARETKPNYTKQYKIIYKYKYQYNIIHSGLPDLVISAETDPVGKGTILLHLLSQDLFSLQGLVSGLKKN